MSRSVYIETYGCQMNVADTELMFGVLGQSGYERADRPDTDDTPASGFLHRPASRHPGQARRVADA